MHAAPRCLPAQDLDRGVDRRHDAPRTLALALGGPLGGARVFSGARAVAARGDGRGGAAAREGAIASGLAGTTGALAEAFSAATASPPATTPSRSQLAAG